MIPSSACPPWQPDEPGQTRRRARYHRRSYTTQWGTIPKTGTTSLQQALLTQYGAPEPQSIWYPIPERLGPGHADMVQRVQGHKDVRPEPTLLDDIARRAIVE